VAEHDQKQQAAEEAGIEAEQARANEPRGQEASGQESSAGSEAEQSPEEIIAGLEAEVAEARDSVLRAQADAQNVKRRAEQDVEKARKYALERFCQGAAAGGGQPGARPRGRQRRRRGGDRSPRAWS
jgi:molecular chaperone GrpE